MTTNLEKSEFIIRLFLEKSRWSQKTIANKAKVDRSTVSRVIRKYKTNFNLARKKGSGRKKGFTSPENAKKVVALLTKNPRLSNRKLAAKVGCNERTVRRMKASAGLRTYKVQTVPDRNVTKNQEAQSRAKKLNSDFFQKFEYCIMDDETYVLTDFSQLPGQEFYTATERGGVEKQNQKKIKVPQKISRVAGDL